MVAIETKEIKAAKTQYGVASFITDRFSPRAFSDKEISAETMNTLFEAASWAASANNEQPWVYYFAHKNTEGFNRLFDCLMPGNRPWAKDAAVLVVSAARKTFAANGNNNVAAAHDLGMANAQLLLQACAMDIYGHPIGGFDKQKTAEFLEMGENLQPLCMFALGYLGDAEQLEEPYKSRELSERTRKPLSEFVNAL
ncbi:MAG: nitroreductase family protein [Saprospiraceae bacterium]|nr:nitroreductase family protein [Saprospiraceae bacterium]